MNKALEFQSVSKVFNKGRKSIQALHDVNFSIDEGEVFGFVGPNGAGKSTTIKIILDIINDYEGSAKIYGVCAHKANTRKGLAYVPESPALYDQFTPQEIIHMSLQMHGVPGSQRKYQTEYWLDRLKLTDYTSRRIRQLSKGNVQRVAIAHALAVKPKLLILDEPLSGLDPVGRKEVIELLLEYKNNGGAIFFTSHVLHDVERIADRFGFINNGKLLTTRSPQELTTNDAGHCIVRYQDFTGSIGVGNRLRDGEFEVNLTQDELPAWLEKLNSAGGRLLGIKPAQSLEKIFFQILEESKTTPAL